MPLFGLREKKAGDTAKMNKLVNPVVVKQTTHVLAVEYLPSFISNSGPAREYTCALWRISPAAKCVDSHSDPEPVPCTPTKLSISPDGRVRVRFRWGVGRPCFWIEKAKGVVA